MRIRLTDGTREVEIRYTSAHAPSLQDLEGAALRLLQAMDPPKQTRPSPIGFSVDPVSLDSAVELSDQDEREDEA